MAIPDFVQVSLNLGCVICNRRVVAQLSLFVTVIPRVVVTRKRGSSNICLVLVLYSSGGLQKMVCKNGLQKWSAKNAIPRLYLIIVHSSPKQVIFVPCAEK